MTNETELKTVIESAIGGALLSTKRDIEAIRRALDRGSLDSEVLRTLEAIQRTLEQINAKI